MAHDVSIDDFDSWNEIKKKLHCKSRSPDCKKGDIWLCNIGRNIGVEQSCRNGFFARPVLVLRVFNKDMFLAIPITSSDKNLTKKYHYDLRYIEKIRGYAILSQIRVFDNKRLLRKITKVDSSVIQNIKNLLMRYVI